VRLVDDSVLPWLLVTTTNLARNRSRRLIRYQQLLKRLPRDAPPDPAAVATDSIEQDEQRRRLHRALRRVSDVDAALITLTALDGLTTAEAAAAVGINPGAARMRLTRARGRLRTFLAEPDALTPRLTQEPIV
jgi:RNA polymerase sigma-70 factor (ECF subfamily)